MEVSAKEGWTIIHGLVVGTVFLVAFAGGVAGLWSLRPELVTLEGIKERLRRLYLGVWGMALIAWAAPILATAVAFVVSYYGGRLARDEKLRWLTMVTFVAAFLTAAVAGVFGAFINKAAPIR